MEMLPDVWAELGAKVRRFVGSRVNDPHAADDVTQDVMLRVAAHLETLPPGERLPAWVFAVARNAITDHYRAAGLRRHGSLAEVEPAAEKGGDAERLETIRELTPCLLRMVEQLPEPYREAMKLADFEGLDQQEIADRAGISLSGAKSRVQRARGHLREMLLDCCRVERDGRGNVVNYETTQRSQRYCGEDGGGPRCGG